MSVMCAHEEEHYGNTQEKLLGRSILVTIVDLFPHIEVVVSASIEVEWNSLNPVEHEV